MPFKLKQKRREYHKNWHLRNRETVLKQQKEYRNNLKKLVLSKYCKDEIKCECCGEKMTEFLCMDHTDGGGTRHRKEIGRGCLYLWLRKNNFPDGYRVLCYNCNQAISIYGKCPHFRLKSTVIKRV